MPATAEEKLIPIRCELTEEMRRLLRIEAAKRDTSAVKLARQFINEALYKLYPEAKKGGGK